MRGNLGGGREEGTRAISGRENVAHNPNLKGPESSDPLAAVLGLEPHHPITSKLGGHGDQNQRKIP